MLHWSAIEEELPLTAPNSVVEMNRLHTRRLSYRELHSNWSGTVDILTRVYIC
jgi:hypothetical protein